MAVAEESTPLIWSPPSDTPPPKIDTSIPHSARMYDYWLGGKDNFEADRIAAEEVIQAFPGARPGAKANRAFLGRAVRFLVEQGITQFLDIGTGIPTQGNTHEVAQALRPEARIVYVDNDPIVMTHARALLRGTPEGRTTYLEADIRDPEYILNHEATRTTLDFDKPIALLLVAILMFIREDEDPTRLVRRLVEALPSGSYLVISHVTADFIPKEMAADILKVYEEGPVKLALRTREQILAYFDDLEMVDPGLAKVFEWRPAEGDPWVDDQLAGMYAGIARKP